MNMIDAIASMVITIGVNIIFYLLTYLLTYLPIDLIKTMKKAVTDITITDNMITLYRLVSILVPLIPSYPCNDNNGQTDNGNNNNNRHVGIHFSLLYYLSIQEEQ